MPINICIQCQAEFQAPASRIKTCSSRCKTELTKKTNIKKYGVSHPMKSKKIVSKCKKTTLDIYGVDNVGKLESSIRKRRNTCIEKYGYPHPLQNKDILQKQKNTNRERWGVENISQNNDIKLSVKMTNLKKYGTECSLLSQDVIKKISNIMLNKYGVEHALQNYTILSKMKNTMLQRYGASHSSYSPELMEKRKQSRYKNTYARLKNKLSNLVEFQFTLADYSGVDDAVYPFKCLSCDSSFTSTLKNGRIPRCPICNPISGSSLGEREMFDYINSIYSGTTINNDRNALQGSELDVYIPEKKLAIEFNGLYWHSEISGNKSSVYHFNKMQQCESLGIHLLQFWDYEWSVQRDIVKSIIKSQLGQYGNRIYARKCSLREIDSDTYKKFLDRCHIQGYSPASVKLGLIYENDLVSVMSFSKPRFSSHYQWELVRYCSELNTTIIGGARKLFSYFVNSYHPVSIGCYSDRRLFSGNIYKNLGFIQEGTSSPGYNYIKMGGHEIPESRLKFQKHKLSTILSEYDSELSEWENMQLNGYDRIWDCGTTRWNWISSSQ